MKGEALARIDLHDQDRFDMLRVVFINQLLVNQSETISFGLPCEALEARPRHARQNQHFLSDVRSICQKDASTAQSVMTIDVMFCSVRSSAPALLRTRE